MYALVIDGQIQSVGSLPRAARRLDTGEWVIPHDRLWTEAQAAACGYLQVTDVARPADTATTTHDRTIELVAGAPTVVWTERDKTPAELQAEAEADNEATIRAAAEAAIDTNRTIITGADDYLAINNPNNSQIAAQVRSLTQAARLAADQRIKLIRLGLGDFTGTE